MPEFRSEERGSWKQVFGRSHVSPCVFIVKEHRALGFPGATQRSDVESSVRSLLAEFDLPRVHWTSMFSPAYFSTPLLDGLVIEYSAYGWRQGDQLISRMRVVGYKPLRALCMLMDLEPPTRRFKYEESIPSNARLREQIEVQRKRPRGELETFAEQGLVGTTTELLILVRSLFEEP